MNSIMHLIDQGGVVLIGLIALSIFLYERCVHLLLRLSRFGKVFEKEIKLQNPGADELKFLKLGLERIFKDHMTLIRIFIASAPLLGLLGTVMGMLNTFASFSMTSAKETSAGLADGISMALVTTECGLAIAIPAVIIVYYAQRSLQRGIRQLTLAQSALMEL